MRVPSSASVAALVVAIWTLTTCSPGTSAATVRPTRPDVVNRAPSRCDKKCETAKSPVCGTNDVTYDNYCLYNVASCKNKTLAVAYMKACANDDGKDDEDGGDDDDDNDDDDDVRTPAPVTKPPSATKAPITVVVMVVKDEPQDQQAQVFEASVDRTRDEEARAQADYCAIECSSVEDFVCGTDGLTYTNECTLLAAKCTDPKLALASVGKCPIGSDKCARYCTREYEPVCGSDGVTYGNACTLAEANCRAGGSLKVVAKRACSDPSDGGATCGGVKCNRHEKCITDKLQKGGEYCAELCDAVDDIRCEKHEVCVLSQVVCKKAPCSKQPTCIKA